MERKSKHPMELLCEKDIAAELGVSLSTVRLLRYKGGGVPFFKIGGSVRYKAADLKRFVQAQIREAAKMRRAELGNEK